MTALVVLEQADLHQQVEIPAEAVGVEGSSMYLKAGEVLTVEDLLYGLMLSSGNDAAVALALCVAGSIQNFADLMNTKAQTLGLADTHFANPNGLDSQENYSTARSLGKLAQAAMENEAFRTIVSTKTYSCPGHSLVNHNKLLWQYDGAVGVKTGFTRQAGRLLVGSAERNGRRIISVTIQAPDDWNDHQTLLDYGFSLYQEETLVVEGTQVGTAPVISGTASQVPLLATETVTWYLLPGETPSFQLDVPMFVYAPVEAGKTMGELRVYVGTDLVGTVPVVAGEDSDEQPQEQTLWEKIRN
jgi:D-alanyl-D-alanine carboxypeptidase